MMHAGSPVLKQVVIHAAPCCCHYLILTFSRFFGCHPSSRPATKFPWIAGVQSINQSIDQSINESINQLIDQSTNQSTGFHRNWWGLLSVFGLLLLNALYGLLIEGMI
jgi:hypothetical protein